MNGGILHAARPADSMPKGKFGGVPPEAIAMARQMGLTPEDMKQMNSMWKNMDDLAESDPDAYHKFTSDILAEGPPGKGGKAKTFVPEASFVVKLKTKDGEKVFVNMTSHEALEPPKDSMGRPVQKGERRNAEGLQIPLLVSELRRCPDHSGVSNSAHAVDCVFNPWVTERCADDNFFKATTIDLAIEWAKQETGLSLQGKGWKTIKSKYKGGLGEEQNLVLPFPISRAMNQDGPLGEREEEKEELPMAPGASHDCPKGAVPGLTTLSPESLLRAAKGQDMGQSGQASPASPGVTLSAPGTTGGGKSRGPLIQEVGSESDFKPEAEDEASEAAFGGGEGGKSSGGAKRKPAVKAGFLRSKPGKKVPEIYDEKGSSGDGMKEGTYSRFMGKCKVVDMSSMNEDEAKKAMEEHAGGSKGGKQQPSQATSELTMNPTKAKALETPSESVPKVDAFSGLGRGFLGGDQKGLYKDEVVSSQGAGADALFDQIVQGIDPDFLDATNPLVDPENPEGVAGQLEQLASILAGGGAPGQPFGGLRSPEPPPKTRAPCRGIDTEGPGPQSTPGEQRGPPLAHKVSSKESGKAEVAVELPPGLDFADVSVEVGDAEIRVAAPGRPLLKVVAPFRVDKGKIKAKFSKAKSSLKITLFEASHQNLDSTD